MGRNQVLKNIEKISEEPGGTWDFFELHYRFDCGKHNIIHSNVIVPKEMELGYA